MTLDITINTIVTTVFQSGAPNRGGGLGGSQPPLNFGWGVEHLSTPPDFEKFFLGGLAALKLI